MALALKCMRSAGANVPINPDEFLRQHSTPDQALSEITEEKVKLEQWKRLEMSDGKKRTKIVEKEISKDNFIALMRVQICEFQEHVSRVRTQYNALSNLKANLPSDQAIIQMDFSENFICSSADEVQSAYWNSNAITLHPVVTYYKDNDELKHTNYVYVSDDLGHNIGTVYTVLKKLIPEVKTNVENLRKVHYWTDSPSSQYRNKTAFYITSDHDNIFGVKAMWNYFETGRGKGPCDGIGGTAKRTADTAITQGKITVQDAREFHDRVQKYHTSANYFFISSEECTLSRDELALLNHKLVPVKGTMQIHCVSGEVKGVINTSVTSCYCQCCISGEIHDTTRHMLLKELKNTGTEREIVALYNNGNLGENCAVELEEGDFVAGIYENNWHIGKIIKTDSADCLVSFMRKSQGFQRSYKWPTPKEDKIWIEYTEILCKIKEPTPTGRSGRSFEITDDDCDHASDLLEIKLSS